VLSAKLIPIRGSSCFNASGYFDGRAVFRYKGNGRVIYRNIPVDLWQKFMEAAPSKGRFFNQHIKNYRTPSAREVGQ
jgi:hypothetical protein